MDQFITVFSICVAIEASYDDDISGKYNVY